MRCRRREITQQISEVRAFKSHPALTLAGTCLARLLIRGEELARTEERTNADMPSAPVKAVSLGLVQCSRPD